MILVCVFIHVIELVYSLSSLMLITLVSALCVIIYSCWQRHSLCWIWLILEGSGVLLLHILVRMLLSHVLHMLAWWLLILILWSANRVEFGHRSRASLTAILMILSRLPLFCCPGWIERNPNNILRSHQISLYISSLLVSRNSLCWNLLERLIKRGPLLIVQTLRVWINRQSLS